MLRKRIIARLDIKGNYLIKGVHLEGLRKVGNPVEYAKRYAEEGVDEIIVMDVVASLYGRDQSETLLNKITADVFVPISAGGGLKSNEDVRRLHNAGADKVVINSAAIRRPSIINDIVSRYGSQCLIVSIETKRRGGSWEALCDNGRTRTGKDALEWAREAIDRGAGEILFTSVDYEGTRKGFDVELLRAVGYVAVPIIISGGYGCENDVLRAAVAGADAIAIADGFHYNRIDLKKVREILNQV